MAKKKSAARKAPPTKPAAIRQCPPLGAHMSIAGGLYKALERGKELDCEIIQLFTKSNSQWAAKDLTELDLDLWAKAREDTGVNPVMAHTSYLINLGSPEDDLFERSVEAMATEIVRCSLLEIPFLVVHPGSHMNAGESAGIKRVVAGLDLSIEAAAANEGEFRTTVLLEATAGQGTNLGFRFEHLRDLLGGVAEPSRFAVCLDTCHVFAAGYDLRGADGFGETMDEFDQCVGIQQIRAWHLNDSQRECGSRIDRHADIGDGEIGPEAFQALLRDGRFAGTPMALETPKGDDGDRRNLSTLRLLFEG